MKSIVVSAILLLGAATASEEPIKVTSTLARTKLPYASQKPSKKAVEVGEVNSTESYNPVKELKDKNSKAKKATPTVKKGPPRSSPTGDDFLLLDLLRYSAYEHTIRSDSNLISNTSGPLLSLNISEGHSAVVVEVPHIVQVWSVRVPSYEGGQWLTNPDATATHFFAVEHAATAADRGAVTGVDTLSGTAESSTQFSIKGHAYPSEKEEPAWWVDGLNSLRNGPIGSYFAIGSAYIQEQILKAEVAVKGMLLGTSRTATGIIDRAPVPLASCGNSLSISEASLTSLSPKTPMAGAFIVALRLGGSEVKLAGNYSFRPTNGFLPSSKIDLASNANPHNFFDYALSFSASGPVTQTAVEGSASPTYTCTHYRAIAQYDKKHVAVTTFWVSSSEGAKCIFERTFILGLQETAASDVRFGNADADLDEDERQRFRFVVDAQEDGTMSHFATVATFTNAEGKQKLITPKLRRLQVREYYTLPGATRSSSSSSHYTDILFPKSVGSRVKRLGPTILLLIVVTLVKFGPRLYLNWLDAKQQKRKGAMGIADAMKVLEGETLATGRGRSGNDGNGSISAAAAAAKELAKEKARKKNYGSGQHLAKAEAILKEHIAKNPNWPKEYEEALGRRKVLTEKEKAEYQLQERALLEQMKREDGL